DHALALAKQVRKDAGVLDRDFVEAVGDDEIDGQRICASPDRILEHDAAEPETRAVRHVAGLDFARRVEIGHVLLQCESGQGRGDGARAEDQADQDETAFSAWGLGREGDSETRDFWRAMRPRNSASTRRRASSGATTSIASTRKNTAYEPHT